MSIGLIVLIVIAVIVLLLVVYAVSVYNGLVTKRNRVRDQWAQIDVQLKRRADLIPNLVEAVKGYAKHEKSTFEEVIKARNNFNEAAGDKALEMEANNQITDALSKLFALSENYPELKANENFMSLQADLKDTEDKISYARQFYNDTVLTYNNVIEQFPSNIIASMFHFQLEKFFEATTDEERNAPKVSF